ncbi:hypothetical protein ONS95_013474 [Cadophora gregata]|uniref:uncharacterized protein n=1 Tax=Cadophora gregata TaxID=51156 RepID=UPI0026DCC470|nr:uncharacterized protein ONS95_013474 [Cadophora gregata]KAK0116459.1 hypothetical protein ONS95_013474 [Cadophora gregata]
MSNSNVRPLRTSFMLAMVVFYLIWSLFALDMPSFSSQISKDGVQQVITEAQNNAAKADVGSTTGTSSGENTGVLTTIPSAKGESSKSKAHDRPLILYTYADSKDGSALENLKFFVAHGLHAAADFVFILNGKTKAEDIVPDRENVRIVQRPNECYDLGAFSEVLQKDDLYKRYKRFITMNASIRGPFVPYWSEDCWTDMFLSKITDEVKLVGMTANCWPTFHIQSMIWATDLIGIETLLFPPQKALDYLSTHPITLPPAKIKTENPAASSSTNSSSPEATPVPQAPGINGCFADWDAAVAAEVSSTSLIRAAGYKVEAMMSAYHGNAEYEEGKSCSENRDVLWEGGYFGISVHPFETVFIKANRDLSQLVLKRYTQWVDQMKYSSYDYCRV